MMFKPTRWGLVRPALGVQAARRPEFAPIHAEDLILWVVGAMWFALGRRAGRLVVRVGSILRGDERIGWR
jgi:hypothetical protein